MARSSIDEDEATTDHVRISKKAILLPKLTQWSDLFIVPRQPDFGHRFELGHAIRADEQRVYVP